MTKLRKFIAVAFAVTGLASALSAGPALADRSCYQWCRATCAESWGTGNTGYYNCIKWCYETAGCNVGG